MMQATLSPYSSPGYRRNTIDEGFIAALIDGGPALLGVILACTQLAVVTWGIYGDIVSAFLLAESTRFVTLATMATVIIATVSYMFGRLAESDDSPLSEASSNTATDGAAVADSGEFSWPAEPNPSVLGPSMDHHAATAMATNQHASHGSALRTRFFSEVANELRTPITSICLAARIIRKHHASTPEVVERFGETLVNEATRLGELVNEFLELVRLESGCVCWRDEDVPVLELMQTAESYLAELAQLQQRRITVHVDEDLAPLNCDRERIVQVLTVLLSTAFSNTAENEAIGLYAFQHDGHTIFSITPEDADPLSFRRSGRAAAPANKDNSKDAITFAIPTLTFNICQEIVAHYGGCIAAEQRSNDTTVFRVSIPQSRSQQCTNPAPLDYTAAQADEALTPARPMVLAEEDAAVKPSEDPAASMELNNDKAAPWPSERQAVAAPSERHGLETLSAEQAEELLSLPADYAAGSDNSKVSTPEADGPSSLEATNQDGEAEYAEVAIVETASEPPSEPGPAQDSDTDTLITPPPAIAAVTAPAAIIPQLPAPQSLSADQRSGVPALRTSAAVAEMTPTAGPPVATDSTASAVVNTAGTGRRRGTMIDPPIAGVGPGEDWQTGASNQPSHRSPAPWLAERLRQAAGPGITREHRLHDDDATTRPPQAEEPRPQDTPISRLHGHDRQPPVTNGRAHVAAASTFIRRRKLGG